MNVDEGMSTLASLFLPWSIFSRQLGAQCLSSSRSLLPKLAPLPKGRRGRWKARKATQKRKAAARKRMDIIGFVARRRKNGRMSFCTYEPGLKMNGIYWVFPVVVFGSAPTTSFSKACEGTHNMKELQKEYEICDRLSKCFGFGLLVVWPGSLEGGITDGDPSKLR